MAYKFERRKKVEKLFSKAKIVTINEVKNTLDTGCSMTAFRYIKDIGYLSSYNNAGKFYTMPHIPKFDKYGLWFYKAASFSKYGTLKSTISYLIKDSQEGFTHRALKETLRCRVQNTLSDLTKNNLISRESVNGLFVYVSPNKEIAVDQVSQREKRCGIGKREGKAIELPIVIEVLLELLGSPVWEAKIISQNLNTKKIFVTEQQVREVLYIYNLKKKR